jgi:hypothetical protein
LPLDFCVMHFGFRIFKTSRRDIVAECFDFMGFALPSKILPTMSADFFRKLATIDNAPLFNVFCYYELRGVHGRLVYLCFLRCL